MKQTTKIFLTVMAIAVTVGTMAAVIAKLLMALVDVYYPGWGDVVGIAMVVALICGPVLALERGWMD